MEISLVLIEQVGGVIFSRLAHHSAHHAPHFTLSDLAKLDLRLEAHIDGLRIGADPAWDLCLAAIPKGDVFPAALLAFESNNPARIEAVLSDEIATAQTDQLISALTWLPPQQAAPHFQRLLAFPSATHRSIGIAAAAAHHQDPGSALLDAISSPDIPLKARALRALGELGPASYRRDMEPYLLNNDANCRYWGAWSATLLGRSWPLETLRDLAEAGGLHHQESAALAARRMGHDNNHAQALAWRQTLTGSNGAKAPQTRAAIRIAQGLADPALIPWLIELMQDPAHSRAAGEAFSMITGTDIAYLDLDLKQPPIPIDRDTPPADATAPQSEPDAEDQDLPWPDPAIISRWWTKYGANFQPGTRYLLGQPISIASATHALKFGYQRQRAAAALELVLLQPGPLFNTAAPGFRQMRALGLQRKDFKRGRPEW